MPRPSFKLGDAVYSPTYQHARPMLVLAAWAGALFGAVLWSLTPGAPVRAAPDDVDLGL